MFCCNKKLHCNEKFLNHLQNCDILQYKAWYEEVPQNKATVTLNEFPLLKDDKTDKFYYESLFVVDKADVIEKHILSELNNYRVDKSEVLDIRYLERKVIIFDKISCHKS